MKTCSKYLLITIVILTVATCENTNHLHAQPDRIKDDDNTISISLDMNKENKEPVDLSVYIDSVGYIRLDNSDECLIGKIQKVFFYEGRYYIQDNKAGSVFVFDETGKFQCKISKKGRGPGEYAKISHLLIDYNKRQILIYDEILSKMLYYTLDCKHIKDIYRFCDSEIIRDLFLLPEGNFLCYTPGRKNYKRGIWKVDSTGKFDKFLWEATVQYPRVSAENHIYFYERKDNQAGLLLTDFNDIIHFSNDSLYKYMSVKTNRKGVSDYPGYDIDNAPDKHIMRIISMTEKDNFILTAWGDHSGKTKISLYSKKEKKTTLSFGTKYGEKVIAGNNIHFNRPDQLMSVIYSHNVDSYLENKYVSEEQKSMLRSMFGETEDDNPVLEVIYLKK